ncbi:MAG TPA: HetP family heterocyst commitment protein [Nostocaceae cyanobacterium]|nr:HetP family heterocyst commitment protein [Nostocaceae cyanobacterium]
MNYQFSSSQKNCQSAITPEQLNQIIEAIADGRYSWACVLILRFIGYNPLHYIPQRTYSRLIKDNNQAIAASANSKQQVQTKHQTSVNSSNRRTSTQVLSKI